MKILVIDDDPNQLFGLELSLKSKGYSVMVAGNGPESLTLFGKHASAIDAILCDYSMPGMNGLGVLDHVRKHPAHIPMVLMTAFGSKELILEALRRGCDGFIEKPFTLEQLLVELDRVLTRKEPNGDEGAQAGQMQH
jgi:CheY-like chemotaxis protein